MPHLPRIGAVARPTHRNFASPRRGGCALGCAEGDQGPMRGVGAAAMAGALAALAGGCTHERTGPVEKHFADFATVRPAGNTVYVCHAYGCRMQTRFRFTDADIAALGTVMAKTRKADTPAEERRAVAYAIGWME